MTSAKPKSRKVAWVVLGVVVLLGLSLLATLGGRIWEAAAYRETYLGSFRVLYKRASWLPGETCVVPDQTCSSCSKGKHGACRGGREIRFIGRPELTVPANWRCVCVDPVHELLRLPTTCFWCKRGAHYGCIDTSCTCPKERRWCTQLLRNVWQSLHDSGLPFRAGHAPTPLQGSISLFPRRGRALHGFSG